MNNIVRRIKENTIPVIVALMGIALIVAAFYFYHPASPYFKRYTFVVRYEMVGTLSEGNRVLVRGIPVGEISKVELTEEAVYVTARVLADTRISRNSQFNLITSGLMGERELSVLTSEDTDFIQQGDTVSGHFDEGTSGLGSALGQVLTDIDSIKGNLTALLDSVTEGSMGQQIDRIVKKGGKLVNTTKALIKDVSSQVSKELESLEGNLDKCKSTLNSVVDRGGESVETAKGLLDRVDGLLSRLNELKSSLDQELSKTEKDDNTVGLILQKDGKMSKELDRISKDVDALVKDIKKSGVKLNVDFF